MTGLLPGSVYFFRVAGVNRMGQGPWSETTDMVRHEARLLHTPTTIKAPVVGARHALESAPSCRLHRQGLNAHGTLLVGKGDNLSRWFNS